MPVSTPMLTPLDTGWSVRPGGPTPAVEPDAPIAATVPGCVHLDLLAAGAIDDPYRDFGEQAQTWIGDTVWEYRTTIVLDPDRLTEFDCHELVFDGLDTFATVSLNGTVVGRTANMHRRYGWEVTALLRAGRNELSVVFDAPTPAAEMAKERYGERPSPYPTPFPYIRKMASNFGWDWGPTLVTSGIWRTAWLRSWSGARLDEVRLSVGLRGPAVDQRGAVDLSVRVAATGPSSRWLEIAVANRLQRIEVDESGWAKGTFEVAGRRPLVAGGAG